MDGGAGLQVLGHDDIVLELHASAGTRSSSFQAEKAALKEAIQWLSCISSWASAIIIYVYKSLVQAVSNTNSADSFVIQLQAEVAVLYPDCVGSWSQWQYSIPIVWAPGHCDLPGTELADL